MKALQALQSKEMLVTRRNQSEDTRIEVGSYVLGSEQVIVVAGPCAVESEDILRETAFKVRAAGAMMLRGGAFKPRTSPYSFQGLGEKGLKILARVGEEMNMPVVSELMDSEDIELLVEHVDIVQIGARNMQNFSLLRKLGRIGKPVILKRGMAATIEEWLMAAEYVLAAGNPDVILCERGVRSSEPWTRNTLDLSAVALVKSLSHLPVMVDPSHGTGVRGLVAPMARAAVAAGADGLMIEVHPCPEKALSDGEQSLLPAEFSQMMRQIEALTRVMGRRIR
ncbi:MAG: 3-deoxy-7-phosphoheptulonate synthase [Syntrophomonadaceae bacterium]